MKAADHGGSMAALGPRASGAEFQTEALPERGKIALGFRREDYPTFHVCDSLAWLRVRNA
jgi:hypothetical protein